MAKAAGEAYKQFRFRVKLGRRYVAGFNEMSGLPVPADASTSLLADDRRLRGLTRLQIVTLERGITHDAMFEQWAAGVAHESDAVRDRVIKAIRKTLVVESLNETGEVASAYTLRRCRVLALQSLPDHRGDEQTVLIQHMQLEYAVKP